MAPYVDGSTLAGGRRRGKVPRHARGAGAPDSAPPGDPPSTQPGRSRRRPRRSLAEKILLGVIVVVLLALLGAGTLYGYLRYRWGQVAKVAVPSLSAPSAGAPFNVLLVGSDSRQGETNSQQASQFGSPSEVVGARSDVIKILHIDPAAGTARILDIPRDTIVALSGAGTAYGRYNRVNVPYGVSADALVQTIQNTFGIPISHYIAINFFGFVGAVDSVGGVYMNFPYPAKDAYTGLNITQTGCQLVNGGYALAVARSRHYEYLKNGYWQYDPTSDYGRIQRQDAFLKALIQRAESRYNPLTLNAFLGSIVHDVTIDNTFSLGDLVSLSQRYHAFSPSGLQSLTLPTYSVGYWGSFGDVLFVKEPDAQAVITQFLGGPPQTPTTPPLAPSGYPLPLSALSPPQPSGTTATTSAAGTTTSTTAPPPAAYNPTPC
ncbi:MAG TPA: LCP family protein [Acidimicrobiales bacterium]|nr:LCP family protein [Acidimicrobiales bacterium]